MNTIAKNLSDLKDQLPESVTLVAVSKTKPNAAILSAYDAGQRIFGENKVQEMVAKYEALPKDIEWHMIGHLQRNKVKYMAEFVSLVHAVDSLKLLQEINKQAAKHDRVISCLLQVKIAEEDTKFGLDPNEVVRILEQLKDKPLQHIKVVGLMGMATFTTDESQIKREFHNIKTLYDSLKEAYQLTELSIGMSGDYPIAIEEGSSMIRVGSAIFGARNYH